jgi:heptosyltransferase II
MKTLIIKLGATGDVVRTTTLLHPLAGEVTWITAAKNASLLIGTDGVRTLTWEEREAARDQEYELVINLEDSEETADFAATVRHDRTFGAFREAEGGIAYSEDAREWFDLSLISRFGRQQADRLKLLNRRTYQDLVFDGLGLEFQGEPYVLPKATDTGLRGDVALSPVAGPVWPMKAWAFYDQLRHELESRGLVVNVLPTRATLLEHLGDVQGHRCLVSGDSLPMHLALGSGLRCVSLFTCTSPWEIHDYGRMTKIVSPLLSEFFYQRGFDERAITAIALEEVLAATLAQLEGGS